MTALDTDSSDQAPAFVYVPTADPAGEQGELQLELREFGVWGSRTRGFTDEDLLVSVLGAQQGRTKIAVLDLLLRLSSVELPIAVNPRLRDHP